MGTALGFRLPDSVTSALEDGGLSTIRSVRLYPQDYPVTESTPGTWNCRMPRKKIPSDTTGDRSRDLPISSTMP
jgi:hypothetical protein